MKYSEAIIEVSKKLDLPESIVKQTYESYWKFIRDTIQSLPLKEDLNEEEFKSLRTNINVPSIGKLSVTWDSYQRMKERFKILGKLRNDYNNKESKTNV